MAKSRSKGKRRKVQEEGFEFVVIKTVPTPEQLLAWERFWDLTADMAIKFLRKQMEAEAHAKNQATEDKNSTADAPNRTEDS